MTPAARIKAALAAYPGSLTSIAQGLRVSRALLYAWAAGKREATEQDAERVVTLAARMTRDALTRLEAL
jgi:hypothetical protein